MNNLLSLNINDYAHDEIKTLYNHINYKIINYADCIILWIIAGFLKEGVIKLDEALNLIKLSKKKIFLQLKFSNVAFNLINKIKLESFNYNNFLLVKKFIYTNNFPKFLYHSHSIYLNIFYDTNIQIYLESPVVKMIFLTDSEIDQKAIFNLFYDSIKLIKILNVENLLPKLTNIKSLPKLLKLHDYLSDNLNAHELHLEKLVQKFGVFFPSPPFFGNNNVIHINNIFDLKEEAILMHNCVLSYAEEAYGGILYFYKVIIPERCTLGIQHEENSSFIYDFKSKYNNEPDDSTKYYIMKWVDGEILNW